MNLIDRALDRVDRFQRARPWLAFPFAVVKKFGDDQAGNLAALVAYYGFFSLFPLLLVFTALLGFVLAGHEGLQHSIINSALGQFPVIGDQLEQNVGSLRNGVALGLGSVAALWAGLGVTQAAQNAMNEIWDVPKKERPNFFVSRGRGLGMLGILGTMTIITMFLSGLTAASGELGVALRIVGLVGSLLVNLALYLVAFRLLTRKKLRWGDVFAGATVGAVAWTILQLVGNYYVSHQVKNATSVYGTFALVIGLLVWLYLGAQVTLYAAEINVVRKLRLWPRSMQPGRTPTEADRTAAAAERLGAR